MQVRFCIVKEILNDLPYNPITLQADKEFVAKKYNITVEELNLHLNLPPKTYKFFPNKRL